MFEYSGVVLLRHFDVAGWLNPIYFEEFLMVDSLGFNSYTIVKRFDQLERCRGQDRHARSPCTQIAVNTVSCDLNTLL